LGRWDVGGAARPSMPADRCKTITKAVQRESRPARRGSRAPTRPPRAAGRPPAGGALEAPARGPREVGRGAAPHGSPPGRWGGRPSRRRGPAVLVAGAGRLGGRPGANAGIGLARPGWSACRGGGGGAKKEDGSAGRRRRVDDGGAKVDVQLRGSGRSTRRAVRGTSGRSTARVGSCSRCAATSDRAYRGSAAGRPPSPGDRGMAMMGFTAGRSNRRTAPGSPSPPPSAPRGRASGAEHCLEGTRRGPRAPRRRDPGASAGG
jgi:hypothetical protein